MARSKTPWECPWCGATTLKRNIDIQRAAAINAPLYCNRICAGHGRRQYKGEKQKKAEKSVYDLKRRTELGEKLRAEKRAVYYANHQKFLERAKEWRQSPERKVYHREYCRQPLYKKEKKKYDRQHRAEKFYGEYAEAAMLLQDLTAEILSRTTKEEIYVANGTACKAQKRKRAYAQIVGPRIERAVVGHPVGDTAE